MRRRDPLSWLLIGLIRLYRMIPKTVDRCRYHPTCSAYGLEAISMHGPFRGTWLAIKRVGRCHPWGGTGLDPVPPPRRRRADREAEQQRTSPAAGNAAPGVVAGATTTPIEDQH